MVPALPRYGNILINCFFLFYDKELAREEKPKFFLINIETDKIIIFCFVNRPNVLEYLVLPLDPVLKVRYRITNIKNYI